MSGSEHGPCKGKNRAGINVPVFSENLRIEVGKMKKQGVIFKAMASFLLALAVFLPLSAKAEIAGLYIEPKISYGIQYGALYLASDSMGETKSDGFDDSTFGGGLAVGYDMYREWNYPLRMELEFMRYGKASYSASLPGMSGTADVQLTSMAGNVYADWHNGSRVTPYAMAGMGLGISSIEASGSVFGIPVSAPKEDSYHFLGQVGLGCGVDLTESVTLDLGMRCGIMPSTGGSGTSGDFGYTDIHIASDYHSFVQGMMGLRFTF